jgi:hypothetical protein
MRCEKARRNIPLFAGDELPERKARSLKKHLEQCESCQKELKEYEIALASLKSVVLEEVPDWEEAEWKSLMQKVREQARKPALSSYRFKPGMAWASAFIFLLVVGLVAILFRDILRKPPSIQLASESISSTQAGLARTFDPAQRAASGPVKDIPYPVKKRRVERLGDKTILASVRSHQKPSQDQLSVSLVSQETGLRVHWTFNKNFEWKETER